MVLCLFELFVQMVFEVLFGYNDSGEIKIYNYGVIDCGCIGEQLCIWDLVKFDLVMLMDFSQKLNFEGEIIFVMVWGMVMMYLGVNMLRMEDFRKLVDELVGKVRCYGYVDF